MKTVALIGFILIRYFGFTQISAPGITKNGSASWLAIGIQRELKENQSINAYLGIGRVSSSIHYNPFQIHSIHVVKAELKQKLASNWSVGLGISHRVQQLNDISIETIARQEFRLATFIKKKWQVKRTEFSISGKEEFRLFFDKDFHHWEEPIQWRTRFKAKFGVALDSKLRHKMSVSSEELFPISKHSNVKHSWGKFHYGDTRVCLYYSYSPKNTCLTIDLGYMSDFISYSTKRRQVDYMMVDLIVKLRNKNEKL